MTNELVVIINSFKVPKIKKILLYEMKFLVPNYSCLQNPWLGGYRPQIPVLSVLNWICWTPPPIKIPGYATGQCNTWQASLATLPVPCKTDVAARRSKLLHADNTFWHKYELPNSEVRDTAPRYSVLRNSYKIPTQSNCWSCPSSRTHTENQHPPFTDLS